MAREGASGAERLMGRVVRKEASVAVLGLGYVGLPLAAAFLSAGMSVIGIDTSMNRIEGIARGDIKDSGVPGETIHKALSAGRLALSQDCTVLRSADVVIICVPTPLTRNGVPDLSYIESAMSAIGPFLREGMLVVLESTTYPGTTEEVLRPAIEGLGLVVGRDVFLAYSPERVDPGNGRFGIRNTPKLVAGVTPLCCEIALALYRSAVDTVVPVQTPRIAEMAKIYENTYRAVNIALVNELTMLCDRMGLSIWEVLDAAGTKPFGLEIFQPGPGVGGHCIPFDPFYLSWKAKEFGVPLHFIELAGEINRRMPHFVVDKAVRLLNDAQKPCRGARVSVLGVAYKRDISDTRESPGVQIVNLLAERGADVSYHDPYVPRLGPAQGSAWTGTSVTLDEAISGSDCILIAVDHSAVDYDLVLHADCPILDARNALRKTGRDTHRVTVL